MTAGTSSIIRRDRVAGRGSGGAAPGHDAGGQGRPRRRSSPRSPRRSGTCWPRPISRWWAGHDGDGAVEVADGWRRTGGHLLPGRRLELGGQAVSTLCSRPGRLRVPVTLPPAAMPSLWPPGRSGCARRRVRPDQRRGPAVRGDDRGVAAGDRAALDTAQQWVGPGWLRISLAVPGNAQAHHGFRVVPAAEPGDDQAYSWTRLNSWAPVLLQVYCCSCTPLLVEEPGVSMHSPELSATKL
jgi:hypothetical protein